MSTERASRSGRLTGRREGE